MNKIYKLKFDRKRQQLIVVSELATGAGKDKTTGDLLAGALQNGFGALTWLTGKLTPVALGLLLTATLPALSHAADLPTGGQIVGGQGQINTSGNQMTIHQQTQKLAANWQSFDIGANHSVQFVQPDSSAIALNRVTGQSASQIMGQLSANGKVFLINPNGVMVGKGATVNTAGFLASTKNLSVSDFMQGNYRLSGGSAANAEIINQGSLTTTKGGFIVLAADKVRNEGTISTPGGTTVLAAAQQITLTLDSNGLTGVSVNGELVNALVENKGLISARDGKVYLTARGQDMLVKTVVNNTGIIDASSMTAKDGVIHIGSGDSATVSATVSTTAGTGGGNSTNTPTTTNNNTSGTTNTASNTSNPTATDNTINTSGTTNTANNGNNATPGKTAGELANPASGAVSSASGNPANPGGTAANTADGNPVNPASGAASSANGNPASGAVNSANGNPANPVSTAANTASSNPVNPTSGAVSSASGNPANPGGTAANTADGNPVNPASGAVNSANGNPANPGGTAANTADGNPVNLASGAVNFANGNPANPGGTAANTADGNPVNRASGAVSSASGNPANPGGTAANTADGNPVNPASGAVNSANGNPANPGGTAANTADGNPVNPASGAVNSANGNPANPGGTAGNTASGNPVNPASGAVSSASGNPANPGGTAGNTADGNPVNPTSGAVNFANGNPANPGGTAANPASGNPTNPTNAINTQGITDASGISTHAGEIHLDGGTSGVVKQSGKLLANSASGKGGKIFVEGNIIHLTRGSSTEATGATGGGEVLVGGGWQGKDSRIGNSERLVMDKTASINVSASQRGDGGTAVLWSDIYTHFGGDITARGGAQGGDGGKVETSSKDFLESLGTVSASSSQGKNGQWLLDPYNVWIRNDLGSSGGEIISYTDPRRLFTAIFAPAEQARRIVLASSIELALNNTTNVLIDTNGGKGNEAGNIEILDNVRFAKDGSDFPTLTLNADGNINIYNNVVFDGSRSGFRVSLNAIGNINFSGTGIRIALKEGNFSAYTRRGGFNITSGTSITGSNIKITASEINLRHATFSTSPDNLHPGSPTGINLNASVVTLDTATNLRTVGGNIVLGSSNSNDGTSNPTASRVTIANGAILNSGADLRFNAPVIGVNGATTKLEATRAVIFAHTNPLQLTGNGNIIITGSTINLNSPEITITGTTLQAANGFNFASNARTLMLTGKSKLISSSDLILNVPGITVNDGTLQAGGDLTFTNSKKVSLTSGTLTGANILAENIQNDKDATDWWTQSSTSLTATSGDIRISNRYIPPFDHMDPDFKYYGLNFTSGSGNTFTATSGKIDINIKAYGDTSALTIGSATNYRFNAKEIALSGDLRGSPSGTALKIDSGDKANPVMLTATAGNVTLTGTGDANNIPGMPGTVSCTKCGIDGVFLNNISISATADPTKAGTTGAINIIGSTLQLADDHVSDLDKKPTGYGVNIDGLNGCVTLNAARAKITGSTKSSTAGSSSRTLANSYGFNLAHINWQGGLADGANIALSSTGSEAGSFNNIGEGGLTTEQYKKVLPEGIEQDTYVWLEDLQPKDKGDWKYNYTTKGDVVGRDGLWIIRDKMQTGVDEYTGAIDVGGLTFRHTQISNNSNISLYNGGIDKGSLFFASDAVTIRNTRVDDSTIIGSNITADDVDIASGTLTSTTGDINFGGKFVHLRKSDSRATGTVVNSKNDINFIIDQTAAPATTSALNITDSAMLTAVNNINIKVTGNGAAGNTSPVFTSGNATYSAKKTDINITAKGNVAGAMYITGDSTFESPLSLNATAADDASIVDDTSGHKKLVSVASGANLTLNGSGENRIKASSKDGKAIAIGGNITAKNKLTLNGTSAAGTGISVEDEGNLTAEGATAGISLEGHSSSGTGISVTDNAMLVTKDMAVAFALTGDSSSGTGVALKGAKPLTGISVDGSTDTGIGVEVSTELRNVSHLIGRSTSVSTLPSAGARTGVLLTGNTKLTNTQIEGEAVNGIGVNIKNASTPLDESKGNGVQGDKTSRITGKVTGADTSGVAVVVGSSVHGHEAGAGDDIMHINGTATGNGEAIRLENAITLTNVSLDGNASGTGYAVNVTGSPTLSNANITGTNKAAPSSGDMTATVQGGAVRIGGTDTLTSDASSRIKGIIESAQNTGSAVTLTDTVTVTLDNPIADDTIIGTGTAGAGIELIGSGVHVSNTGLKGSSSKGAGIKLSGTNTDISTGRLKGDSNSGAGIELSGTDISISTTSLKGDSDEGTGIRQTAGSATLKPGTTVTGTTNSGTGISTAGTLNSDDSITLEGIAKAENGTGVKLGGMVNRGKIIGNALNKAGVELLPGAIIDVASLIGTVTETGGTGVKLAGQVTADTITGTALDTAGVEVAQGTSITNATVSGTTSSTTATGKDGAADSIGVKLLGNNTLNKVSLTGESAASKGVVIEAVAGTDGTNNVLNGDKDTTIKGITGSNTGVGVELHSNVKGKDTETVTTMGVDTVKMMSIIGETKDGINGSGLVVNISNPLAESLVNVSLQGLAKGSGDAVQINSSASLNDASTINGSNSGTGHAVVADGGAGNPITLSGGNISGEAQSGDGIRLVNSVTADNSHLQGITHADKGADAEADKKAGKGISLLGSTSLTGSTTVLGENKGSGDALLIKGSLTSASVANTVSGKATSGDAVVIDSATVENGKIIGTADTSSSTGTSGRGIVVTGSGVQITGTTLEGDSKAAAGVKSSAGVDFASAATLGAGTLVNGTSTTNTGVHIAGALTNDASVKISGNVTGEGADVSTDATGITVAANVNGGTLTGEAKHDGTGIIVKPGVTLANLTGSTGKSDTGIGVALQGHNTLNSVVLTGESQQNKGVVISAADGTNNLLQGNNATVITGITHGAAGISGVELLTNVNGNTTTRTDDNKDPIMRIIGKAEGNNGASGLTVNIADRLDPALVNVSLEGQSDGTGDATTIDSSLKLNDHARISGDNKGTAAQSGRGLVIGKTGSPAVTLEGGKVSGSSEAKDGVTVADETALKHTTVNGSSTNGIAVNLTSSSTLTATAVQGTTSRGTAVQVSGTQTLQGDSDSSISGTVKKATDSMGAEIAGSDTGTAVNLMTDVHGGEADSTLSPVKKMHISGTTSGSGDAIKLSKPNITLTNTTLEGSVTGDGGGSAVNITDGAQLVSSGITGTDEGAGKGAGVKISGKVASKTAEPTGTAPEPVTGSSSHGDGISLAANTEVVNTALNGSTVDGKGVHFAGSAKLNNAPVTGTSTGSGSGVATDGGTLSITGADDAKKTIKGIASAAGGTAITVSDTNIDDGILHGEATDGADGVHFKGVTTLIGVATTGTAESGKAVIHDGALLTLRDKGDNHSSISGSVGKGQPGDAVVLNGDVSGAGKQTKITGTADSGKGVTIAKDTTLANLQVDGTSVSNTGVALDGHNSLTDVELIGKSTDSTGVKIAASADADPAHNVLTGTKNTTITGTTDGAGKGVELLTNVNGGNRMDGDTNMMTITGDASGNKSGTGLVVNIGTPLAPKSLVNVSLNGNADGSGNAVEINSDLTSNKASSITGNNTGISADSGSGVVIDGKSKAITINTEGGTIEGSSVSADGVRLAQQVNLRSTNVSGTNTGTTGTGTGVSLLGGNSLTDSHITGNSTSSTGVSLINSMAMQPSTLSNTDITGNTHGTTENAAGVLISGTQTLKGSSTSKITGTAHKNGEISDSNPKNSGTGVKLNADIDASPAGATDKDKMLITGTTEGNGDGVQLTKEKIALTDVIVKGLASGAGGTGVNISKGAKLVSTEVTGTDSGTDDSLKGTGVKLSGEVVASASSSPGAKPGTLGGHSEKGDGIAVSAGATVQDTPLAGTTADGTGVHFLGDATLNNAPVSGSSTGNGSGVTTSSGTLSMTGDNDKRTITGTASGAGGTAVTVNGTRIADGRITGTATGEANGVQIKDGSSLSNVTSKGSAEDGDALSTEGTVQLTTGSSLTGTIGKEDGTGNAVVLKGVLTGDTTKPKVKGSAKSGAGVKFNGVEVSSVQVDGDAGAGTGVQFSGTNTLTSTAVNGISTTGIGLKTDAGGTVTGIGDKTTNPITAKTTDPDGIAASLSGTLINLCISVPDDSKASTGIQLKGATVTNSTLTSSSKDGKALEVVDDGAGTHSTVDSTSSINTSTSGSADSGRGLVVANDATLELAAGSSVSTGSTGGGTGLEVATGGTLIMAEGETLVSNAASKEGTGALIAGTLQGGTLKSSHPGGSDSAPEGGGGVAIKVLGGTLTDTKLDATSGGGSEHDRAVYFAPSATPTKITRSTIDAIINGEGSAIETAAGSRVEIADTPPDKFTMTGTGNNGGVGATIGGNVIGGKIRGKSDTNVGLSLADGVRLEDGNHLGESGATDKPGAEFNGGSTLINTTISGLNTGGGPSVAINTGSGTLDAQEDSKIIGGDETAPDSSAGVGVAVAGKVKGAIIKAFSTSDDGVTTLGETTLTDTRVTGKTTSADEAKSGVHTTGPLHMENSHVSGINTGAGAGATTDGDLLGKPGTTNSVSGDTTGGSGDALVINSENVENVDLIANAKDGDGAKFTKAVTITDSAVDGKSKKGDGVTFTKETTLKDSTVDGKSKEGDGVTFTKETTLKDSSVKGGTESTDDTKSGVHFATTTHFDNGTAAGINTGAGAGTTTDGDLLGKSGTTNSVSGSNIDPETGDTGTGDGLVVNSENVVNVDLNGKSKDGDGATFSKAVTITDSTVDAKSKEGDGVTFTKETTLKDSSVEGGTESADKTKSGVHFATTTHFDNGTAAGTNTGAGAGTITDGDLLGKPGTTNSVSGSNIDPDTGAVGTGDGLVVNSDTVDNVDLDGKSKDGDGAKFTKEVTITDSAVDGKSKEGDGVTFTKETTLKDSSVKGGTESTDNTKSGVHFATTTHFDNGTAAGTNTGAGAGTTTDGDLLGKPGTTNSVSGDTSGGSGDGLVVNSENVENVDLNAKSKEGDGAKFTKEVTITDSTVDGKSKEGDGVIFTKETTLKDSSVKGGTESADNTKSGVHFATTTHFDNGTAAGTNTGAGAGTTTDGDLLGKPGTTNSVSGDTTGGSGDGLVVNSENVENVDLNAKSKDGDGAKFSKPVNIKKSSINTETASTDPGKSGTHFEETATLEDSKVKSINTGAGKGNKADKDISLVRSELDAGGHGTSVGGDLEVKEHSHVSASAPGTVEVGGNLIGDDYKDGTPLDRDVTKESNNRNIVSAPGGVSVGGNINGVNVFGDPVTVGGNVISDTVFNGNVTFTTPDNRLRLENIFISEKTNTRLLDPNSDGDDSSSGGGSFTGDIIGGIIPITIPDTASALAPNSDGSTDLPLDPYKKWNTETHLTDNDKSEMVELTICRGTNRDSCEFIYMDSKRSIWFTSKKQQ